MNHGIKNTKDKTVLVTGGSGFIAAHCIIKLLNEGYSVRTTIRSANRESEVRAMLKEGGADPGNRISFFIADLMSDQNWKEAISGCEYILHVASPTPLKDYKNDDDVIMPAREGVLRVLRIARDSKVNRVVLTSAFGAIGMGHKNRTTPFTEKDWSNLDADIPVYQRSKTLSERAAWNFIEKEGNGLGLSVINPVGVLGPVLGPDYSHSIQLTRRMLDGEVSRCPKVSSSYVDVRDVADLHVRAMTHPRANGERFIAASGEISLSLLHLALVIRKKFGARAARVPSKEIPNWLLRILGIINPTVRLLVPMLGYYMTASGEKAKTILGWNPRSNEDAITDTAESLLRLGLIKK
jgi:dihydroflavonol-4-reductase